MSMASSTAAPADITLGGKSYRITPFNFKSLGEFLRWVQDAHLESAKRFASVLEGESKNEYLRNAVKQVEELSVFNDEDPILRRYLMSPEGVNRLVYLALRPNHPDITLDEVSDILSDQDQLQAAFEKVMSLNKGEGDEKKTGRRPKAAVSR